MLFDNLAVLNVIVGFLVEDSIGIRPFDAILAFSLRIVAMVTDPACMSLFGNCDSTSFPDV